MADFSQLVKQVVLGDDAANLGRRFHCFVAHEFGRLERLFEGFNGAGLEHDVGDFSRFFAVLFHRLAIAVPVEGDVQLGGHALDHFGRDAVGSIKLGGVVTLNNHAARGPHLVEHFVDAREPSADRAEECRLLGLDSFLHALGCVLELGVGTFHQIGDDGYQLKQEGITTAHLIAVEHSSPQQATNDILLTVGPGQHVFVNSKGAGPHMVGDSS